MIRDAVNAEVTRVPRQWAEFSFHLVVISDSRKGSFSGSMAEVLKIEELCSVNKVRTAT
jgi:hypothetical protein